MKGLLFGLGILALVAGPVTEPMAQDYALQAIGVVAKKNGEVALEIRPAFQAALSGLESYSHVVVLYWFDRNDKPEKRRIFRVHPRGDPRNPLTGVFATRSPVRPNPIGLSTCKITSVTGNRVLVDSIDAFDGSPILDLKPYISRMDCVPGAKGPKRLGGRERR